MLHNGKQQDEGRVRHVQIDSVPLSHVYVGSRVGSRSVLCCFALWAVPKISNVKILLYHANNVS